MPARSVVDGSGAAVPGAAVLLRNADTGFERLAQAAARGQFRSQGLSPARCVARPLFDMVRGDIRALRLLGERSTPIPTPATHDIRSVGWGPPGGPSM